MPKPLRPTGARARSKFRKFIVPQTSAPTQYPLPDHLDRLIDEPWSSDNSKLIDLWLWYSQEEFESVRGAR